MTSHFTESDRKLAKCFRLSLDCSLVDCPECAEERRESAIGFRTEALAGRLTGAYEEIRALSGKLRMARLGMLCALVGWALTLAVLLALIVGWQWTI